MAYISIELHRSDFDLKAWEEWEKGYRKLLIQDLKNYYKLQNIIEQANYIFIQYNDSPYIFKQK